MRRKSSESYKQTMWGHLAEYKVSVLGISSNGIWKRNRKEYPHILPFAHQRLNILKPYREEFWEWFAKTDIKLHTDFHHLSSSQAMCFNVFFPFVAEEGRHMQVLREALTTDGVVKNAQFEVVLREEESTNFDFCISADSRKLFELKFTEESFGTATADESHLLKYRRVYSSELGGKFKPTFCSCETFLRHYQIMRNIWNVAPDNADTLVFLVPKANTSLTADLAFLDKCLSDAYRPRVSVMFLEDLLPAVERNILNTATRMQEHFRLFRQKYLPAADALHPHQS